MEIAPQSLQESVKQIKQAFFAYRNGIVADTYRRSGDPHRIIMGCQLVDIKEIAKFHQPDAKLAQALWNEVGYRECRIIAPMLYPLDQLTDEVAEQWCDTVESAEIAQILCFDLLRHADFADSLAGRLLKKAETDLDIFLAYTLLLNLIRLGKPFPQEAVNQNEHTHREKAVAMHVKSLIERVGNLAVNPDSEQD